MKRDKSLMEMTEQELREHVGALETELDRVHAKNKRRKRSLKQLNRSVIVYRSHMEHFMGKMMALKVEKRLTQARADDAEAVAQLVMDGHWTPKRPSWFRKVFG